MKKIIGFFATMFMVYGVVMMLAAIALFCLYTADLDPNIPLFNGYTDMYLKESFTGAVMVVIGAVAKVITSKN